MFYLDINFLNDRGSYGSIYLESDVYEKIQAELRSIAFSSSRNRKRAAKAVKAIYEYFGHKTPEIKFASSPYDAINLLTQQYQPPVNPILSHTRFLKEWKRILKKQLHPSLINQLSSTELEEVFSQLVQQLMLDGLKRELDKALIKTCDQLGNFLDFPIESALSSAFYIQLGEQPCAISRSERLIQSDPTKELYKQFPLDISLSLPSSSLESQLRIALAEDLDAQIWEKVWKKITSFVNITTRYPLKIVRPEDWLYQYGLWLNICNVGLNVDVKHPLRKIFKAFVRDCGWIFPFQKVCIVCDRPIAISFDDRGNLHADGKPAIKFADGYTVYAQHGVISPQQDQFPKLHMHHNVVPPQPSQASPSQWQTPWLLAEKNVEIKKTLLQSLGSSSGCRELHATVLDIWQEYELLQIKTNLDDEAIHLLKITSSSTGQIQALRVPSNISSAQQARQWINLDKDSK